MRSIFQGTFRGAFQGAFAICVSLSLLLSTAWASHEATDPDGASAWETILVERGQTIDEFLPQAGRGYASTDINPGIDPEGDYLGFAAFTPDGSQIWVTNRLTDNVTVYDWSTMDVVTNIDVGVAPSGIAINDYYAVIACSFSDEVYIVNIHDHSVHAVIPTGVQPWVVRYSPDGDYAYVSCDIDDVCEKIDVFDATHELTISNFPVSLLSFSWNSENGRSTAYFTNFEVTPDGDHLVVGDYDQNVYFFNTTTGAIDYAVPNITDCVAVSLSGDGSKVVTGSIVNPAVLHQIDVATHTETGSVTINEGSQSMYYVPGVNPDGTKAFVGISGNKSAIARFPTSDYTILTSTYTPFWIGVSPDHQKAISGQYRFSIVDFDTESVIGQYQGNTQSYGAVSPVGSRAIGYDPHRHEGIYFYDYTNPSPVYRGTTNAGEPPEGDAPRRVAIAPDLSKLVVTNALSDNATIVNLDTYAIEAILPMGDRVQNLAITHDSQYAVVCCFNSNTVKLIDLATNTVVADVYTGSRPGVISLSPDSQYAYVGNISSNSVSVLYLDGAATYKVTDIACGTIGVVWAAYGVSSDVEASPSGDAVLVAASFDDNVKVIDTVSNTIVATLPTGDFPIQIDFNGIGDYATVTNAFSDNYTVIHVDGASSSVVGTFSVGGTDYPLRLDYNPVQDEMGIGYYSSKHLVSIDPETGAYQGNESYAAYGALIQVEYDLIDGLPTVLTGSDGTTPGHLHRQGEAIPLPAGPAFFDYMGPGAIPPGGARTASRVAAVVMPGPDWLTIVEWLPSGVENVVTIPLSEETRLFVPEPNVITGQTRLGFALSRAGEVNLSLVDVTGRTAATIANGHFGAGEHRLVWQASGLPTGMYQAVLKLGGRTASSQKVFITGGGN